MNKIQEDGIFDTKAERKCTGEWGHKRVTVRNWFTHCKWPLVEKDTVLVPVFGVFLHSLELLLVAFHTPRIVLKLRTNIPFLLHTIIQDFRFL